MEESFYSLGFGGCIELEFADFVGGNLIVYETTWHHFNGDTYPKESADIYVSADGAEWSYLGEANNDGQSWSNTPIPNVFTLEECIKYVRICDTSDPSLFGSGANAFDLDAVEGQYFCKKETAWGDGTRFVDKGNWATYFTYNVECCFGCPGITDSSSNIEELASPPSDIRVGQEESTEYIRVWKEFEGELEKNLYYDLPEGVSARSYDLGDAIPEPFIPAGTPVCIYYVHYDSLGSTGALKEGSLTFGANILGLIISGGNLGTFADRDFMFAADEQIGDPETTYPDDTDIYPPNVDYLRGYDVKAPSNDDDAKFEGAVVNFTTWVSNAHDSMRVILPLVTVPCE